MFTQVYGHYTRFTPTAVYCAQTKNHTRDKYVLYSFSKQSRLWGGCLVLALVAFPLERAYALDYKANCDIRQLDLSVVQNAKLRLIRRTHKSKLDRTQRVVNSANSTYFAHISDLLNRPDFDEALIRQQVQEKYNSRIQYDIEDLRSQHAFLQVLNPKQRQDWLNQCLRYKLVR